MKLVRVPPFVLLVVLSVVSAGPRARLAAQQPVDRPAGISQEALGQIAALLADKQARTPVQQKIDSQLLYEEKMESGAPVADGIWAIETDMPYARDGHLVVDVRTRQGSAAAARLAQAGVEIEAVSDDGSGFRAHVNIAEVETLAADPDVVFVEPRQNALVSQQAAPNVLIGASLAATGQGSRSSQGDVTHRAFAARAAYHTDGTGLKVGVLSDGVKNLAASQAAGDLGPVTVIGPPAPCLATATSCDEGTAMLEIVHDLAPGAQLYFASAFESITKFADNIRALRAAGCDIIVDDVFYPVESAFQDGQLAPTNRNSGVVSQAVNDVTADGALYFSSAGNSGNLNDGTAGVWEGDFVDGGAIPPLLFPFEGSTPGPRLHSFAGQTFNVQTSAGLNVKNLYWSDPLGASTNDYDLFRLNAAGTQVLSASTGIQNGAQDPYEQVSAGADGDRLVIVKFSGASRFLHLNTNRGRLSIPTAGQTHGHAAAADAFGVAATPAGAVFPYAFNSSNSVETFSSDGPRRIFYQANGTPYTPGDVSATGGIVRQKPDITAADGVSVTGVGGFPTTFFGTSAAAAHAAAIAALVKSANPAMTNAQIRSILTSTAIDIEGPGVDRDSGAGIIMARDAVAATGIGGTAFLTVENIDAADNPGNGNGIAEVGEGARVAITLKNNGGTTATAIASTLMSPTAGVTIALPSTLAYPDLAPTAAATRTSVFTTAADLGCPAAANFSLNATYLGGPSPLAVPFAVPIGITTFSITKSLDGSTPPSFPSVVGSTGTQNFRLNREGSGSVCGALKPTPPIFAAGGAGAGARRYDAYAFTSCSYSTPSCVSVTFSGPNSINMFSAAYVPTFDPTDIATNYTADPAVSSTGPLTYSFDLPAGGSQFAVDVHDVPVIAAPSNSQYTLTVSNACLGSCDSPNHPPAAKAKAVAVPAGPACTADASIDDGSPDPDGDPLTFVQLPAGPYALGTTSPVLLTVTDPKGAFGQASGSVTVVDQTPPSILCPAAITTNTAPRLCSAPVTFAPPTASDLCSSPTSVSTSIASGASFPLGTTAVTGTATDAAGNSGQCTTPVTVLDKEPPAVKNVSASPNVLFPPNHKIVKVTINYGTTDNCATGNCTLAVTVSQVPRHNHGHHDDDCDRDGQPDFKVVDAHHVLLRAERNDDHDRIYTIAITCLDASGNKTIKTTTVLVPHDNGRHDDDDDRDHGKGKDKDKDHGKG